MTYRMKRFLNKVFKYSGLKSIYFRYARNTDERVIKCPILLYHSIGDDALSPQLLDEHLDFLSSAFTIIPLRSLYQGIISDDIEKNPLVVTFDDGYRDIYEVVVPILEKYRVVTTMFIATGYIGGKFGKRPAMTQAQIKDLATRGMEIGAHTVSHPNLKRLNRENLRAELGLSKVKLEEITGAPVISLAYPTGFYNPQVIEVAKEVGFKIAVATVHDFFVNPNRLFECPRIVVYPYDYCGDLEAKLNGDQHWLKLAHKLYLPIHHSGLWSRL